MKVQVLVATMNQIDHSLIEKMNIKTEAIVGNQCDENKVDEFFYQGKRVKYLNFSEKGVGLNRNNVLMRADGDICLFADDDMVFCDGYEEIVVELFETFSADVIIFNLDESKETKRRKNDKVKRINYFNYMNYGAARLAVRNNAVRHKGILFNLCFGGGTEHSCGEDTLFLNRCLKEKLKVLAVPVSIARLVEKRPSTWYTGLNDKYFIDKGLLLGLAHPYLCWLFAVYLVLRHTEYVNEIKKSRYEIVKLMFKGIRDSRHL